MHLLLCEVLALHLLLWEALAVPLSTTTINTILIQELFRDLVLSRSDISLVLFVCYFLFVLFIIHNTINIVFI